MSLLNFNYSDNNYSKEYLNGIKNDVFTRMDKNGNSDGKITVNEAYKDLDIGSLLSGLNKGSSEALENAMSHFENSKTEEAIKAQDKAKEVLAKYAGSDGEFSSKEWADFLNGNEWNAVLDAYHSSSNFSKIEMGWIENSSHSVKDGVVSKGAVKAGLLNDLSRKNINIDTTGIEALIDKYAGEDGMFTVEEYTKLKNDKQYKEFLNKYHVVPFD